MLHLNPVTNCDRQRISRDMPKIRRVLIQSAKTSARQNRIARLYRAEAAVRLADHKSLAAVFSVNDIEHHRMIQYRNIVPLLCSRKKLACNLLAGDIFMKQDTRSGMTTLSCKCKLIAIPFKIHTIAQQILCDPVGGTDHDIDGCLIILIVSCFHSIFKIAVIVLLAAQHAHTALCQKGIALIHVILGDHQDLILRQLKCTE